MITLNKNHRKTIVTICNYSDWQGSQNRRETIKEPQKNRGKTTEEPKQEVKEVKEVKEYIYSARAREGATTKNNICARMQLVLEKEKQQPQRNWKSDERKKIVELFDINGKDLLKIWRYYIRNFKKKYRGKSGTLSVGLFYHQITDVHEDWKNKDSIDAFENENMTAEQRRNIKALREGK